MAAAVALVPSLLGAETISTVEIGSPGNAGDDGTTKIGAVGYTYRMGTYEVTNSQYAEFLNAVAKTDTYGLYSSDMDSSASGHANGGIRRSGSPSRYSYSVISGRENNPVIYVDYFDALRFTNWLHNGKPTGAQDSTTTEDGAYTFSDATTNGGRNEGAQWFLPTANEWYKAAYYDPDSEVYYDYATGSDTRPTSMPSSKSGEYFPSLDDLLRHHMGERSLANRANHFYLADPVDNGYAVTGSASFDSSQNYLTDVGEYFLSDSPNGTYDQNGNVQEWIESFVPSPIDGAPGQDKRLVRGGSWQLSVLDRLHSGQDFEVSPTQEAATIGFRVATVVPEPSSLVIGSLALVGTLVSRRLR